MEIAGGKYYLKEVIASGTYGKVYACYPYAVKQLQIPCNGNPRTMELNRKLLANEINILTELNHPNVVRLFEVVNERQKIFLVMEYCQGDLRGLLNSQALGEVQALCIMRQVVEGCKEMVRLGVVHRDLKPANILVDKDVYKIADFGMSRYIEHSGAGNDESNGSSLFRSHVGTPYYMAPQILQRQQYSRKCDIWSLGIIFFEMIFGRLPWEGKNEQILLQNILSVGLKFPGAVSQETKTILERMLTVQECSRTGWQELFKLFELQEKKTITASSNACTFHKSLIKKLLVVERERMSRLEFKCGYLEVTGEENKRLLNKKVEKLFRDQDAYLVREF